MGLKRKIDDEQNLGWIPVKDVRVIILTGFGLNCENETRCAFELAGASVHCVHINDFLRNPNLLAHFHILVLIGGFAFGDHLGAGIVLANRLRRHLKEELKTFTADGKLILGICNGFQTLACLGMLPGIEKESFNLQVALAPNSKGVFRDAWVTLAENQDSPCIFTRGMGAFSLPIRHGEGRFVVMNDLVLKQIREQHLIAIRYTYRNQPTMTYPHNPNGSIDSIAGLCDPSGRVFGMMPHPEAYLTPYHHPQWVRQKITGTLPERGDGCFIFRNAVRYVKENFFA